MRIILVFLMLKMSLFGSSLKIGENAPNFILNDQDGKQHQLSDYKGKKLVIYFFPKAFTPGWTKQACGLRDIYSDFALNNISVLGVSYDSESKLSEFKEQYNLEFDLLSDSKKTMGELYDVNSFYFFPQRKTFLIDENGVLVHIIDSVNINSHANDILAIFKKLKGV